MSEFEYTYEDYLRDQAETEAQDAIFDDALNYNYEDYLRDQFPNDDLYDSCALHILHKHHPPSAEELKRSKGTYMIFWTDPPNMDVPYQTYLEVEDGIARIMIVETGVHIILCGRNCMVQIV